MGLQIIPPSFRHTESATQVPYSFLSQGNFRNHKVSRASMLFPIKENLKIWLNNYRMINDTIDILDAKILNIGVEFQILTDLEANKYDTLLLAKSNVASLMQRKPEIGQHIYISDIINSLKNTSGVLDVVSVNVTNKTGDGYSSLQYDLEANLSKEGRYIKIPDNVAVELKYPNSDIKGVVV